MLPARTKHASQQAEQSRAMIPKYSPTTGNSTRAQTRKIFGDGEMAELTRRFDWSKTPLGPVETWPDTLLTTVNMLLATRHPMFLWWGPELIQFYNDAYRLWASAASNAGRRSGPLSVRRSKR
jgi:hypothetical protein